MGLFSRKEKKIEQALKEYFSVFSAYTPAFTTYEGGIYEMELTRAAVHAFANHVSKLKPEIAGNAPGNSVLMRRLQFCPNALMDTKKYLYRLATMYMVENNAVIAPIENLATGTIDGFYPLVPSKIQLWDYDGKIYVRYRLDADDYFAIEFDRCGILNQFYYKNEIWGENNRCLQPTLELINTQNQGIIAGIKNSAIIRFIAKLVQPLKPKDVEKERDYFNKFYLGSENNGGAMVIDSKYQDVKQIESKPVVINPAQMDHIKQNVFNYFGVNENILQNKFTPDEWNAYYEGKIEPFALELSLVHTNLLFTDKQIAYGNQVFFSANRLQYASISDKISFVKEFGDRGGLSINEAREVFNMAPVEGGDIRYIRGEYKNALEGEGETLNLGDGDNADSSGQAVQNNGEPANIPGEEGQAD